MAAISTRCMLLPLALFAVVVPAAHPRRLTGQMAAAYLQGGAQLAGYSHQAAALAIAGMLFLRTTPGTLVGYRL